MITSSSTSVAGILQEVIDQAFEVLHGIALGRISKTEPISSRLLTDEEASELKDRVMHFFAKQDLMVVVIVAKDLTMQGRSSTIEVLISIKNDQSIPATS